MMNRQIRLAARPQGMPRESDFRLAEFPMPVPRQGEVLVRTLYLSVDPYMRSRISGRRTYAAGTEPGDLMTGGVVGKIIQSNHPDWAVGEIVQGYLGWQEYATSNGSGLVRVDPKVAPISTAIGVLGMPGMTAYFGMLEICRPQEGDTVVVSGAAGAVGSLAGQIAKIRGCRVVGIAGTDRKVDYLLSELGFDAAFNYKTVSNYGERLGELCPNGIDAYFDNVGGTITDAVFPLLNQFARVAICGQISQYNLDQPEMGPRLLPYLIWKQIRVEGFLSHRWADRFPEGFDQMAAWVREGKLRYREQFVEGLEHAPRAFIAMLQGENTGKQLVKVADE